MPPVVSDAGPIHYLVLIDAIDCLPRQFGHVIIPEPVAVELSRPAAPSAVREWLKTSPAWLERTTERRDQSRVTRQRGAGERAAIALATSTKARLLLIDDRAGDLAARACGLESVGTLGILVRAAQLGFVDLSSAFRRLRQTNFRCRPDLLDALLIRHGAPKGD